MRYLFALISAFGIVVAVTPMVRRLAARLGVIDVPGEPRKIHGRPTPPLGGIAIFAGLFLVWWYVAAHTPYLLGASIKEKHLWGLFAGSAVLMLGGYLDDKYNLKPSRQILFPILAALIVIASGIGVRLITNPFGGTISLVSWERVLFWFHGVGYRVTLPADLLTFAWLLGMMYTTKFLDGLDGLVSGLTVIGSIMIMLLATVTRFYQPEVGMLAAVVAGAFAGFLIFNFHPARIFLGEGGSLFAGFLLGTLAVISGGKIATALLVLGVPVLDAGWVIARRLFWQRRRPTIADRTHLHFRLLDAGFSHRGAVVLFWVISAAFGVTTLFLQSAQKLVAFGVLALVMGALGVWVVMRYHRKCKITNPK